MSTPALTPEYIERQYNNRAAVPDHPEWIARWAESSEQARRLLKGNVEVRYGRGPKETMDLFPAEDARGLFVFIHGGYWRSLDKADFSFVATHLVAHGIGVAVLNYDLCPTVSIRTIGDQSRRALLWLARQGDRHGMPAARVVVGGHSAGGHLAALLFATDWSDTPVAGLIRGGVSVSGVFDLEPMVHFSYNTDLGLTPETAREASPANMWPSVDAPMLLCVGADESAEFVRQTQLLWDRWPQCRPHNAKGPMLIPGRHHFSVVSDFAEADSALTRATLDLFERRP